MRTARYLFLSASDGYPWGGSELLWSQTALNLLRRGNEVRVSVKHWGTPVPQIESLRNAGCRVFYRRPHSFLARQAARLRPRLPHIWNHFRTAAESVNLVVISQGANTDGLAWMEASRALGKPYVVVSQGANEQWWPDDAVADRLASAYHAARASYFVSQANLELSRVQFAADLPNAKIVRNPFNVAYDARPAWPASTQSELTLACVARLNASHKGQDLLLQVLALPHWRKRSIHVSLVGDGPHERGLRRNALRFKLTNVAFLGFQTDIQGIWRTHHALVLPSRYEGLPLAIVEAMLCGRPCITTDVAGNRELVRDGINGFLAKAPSVEHLDMAMDRAWNSRDSLRTMGEIAAADVRNYVSSDPANEFASELAKLAER